jgi:nanoRNase/pAp phosphatase (c-di-AMP/oligoRNAs hydrolase)
VSRLADRTGVTVLTGDGAAAEEAREAGIAVIEAPPTDRDALADVGNVRGILIATPDPETALAAAEGAREVHPEAVLVACVGSAPGDYRKPLAALVDRVVDPAAATASAVLDRAGPGGQRLRDLRQVLRGIDRLGVVTHDNPDPDAIASGVALTRVAAASGCSAGVYYYGDITHQENRAFVNLLNFELTSLDAGEMPDADGLALVDHSRPGVNDGLPEDVTVDVVIDHHPPRGPVDARFVDLRSDVGATSTLLVEYLTGAGVTLSTDVATGLLFGVRTDTREFTREVSVADFEAAARLVQHADLGTLDRIESPSISAETFETIAAAIRNRHTEAGVLFSSVGRLSDRDSLAQAADRLVALETVSTAVVHGIADGRIYISARSRDPGLDLGELLRDAFGQIGSAGGHADMAGAQITLGVLDAVEDRADSLTEIVDAVVTGRIIEALDHPPEPPTPSALTEAVDEYLLPEADRPAPEPGGEGADGTEGSEGA